MKTGIVLTIVAVLALALTPVIDITAQDPTTLYEYTLAGGDKVEVGDKETPDFEPHLKLYRWGGESWLKVQMAGDIEGEVEYEVEGDKVKTKYKVKYDDFEQEIETEFYPLAPTEQYELGGFEFNIILNEKPLTNKIVLSIESQELKFYYQPPLTWEEILDGCVRPDNIVGSYAVYHATKRDHILGQTNYMSGKAFHIFRPRIEDATGNWVWGELHYDKQAGTLTTTIPQDFLDTAVYPIRHAAGETFGFSGTPGTSNASDDRIRGSIWTGAAGTVTHISVFGHKSASTNVQGGIYENSDGLRKGYTVTGVLPVDYDNRDWVTMAIDGAEPTTTVQSYWLCGKIDDGFLHFDAGATPYRYLAIVWANPWPADMTGFTTSGSSRDYGVYATYTPPGVPPDAPTNVSATDGAHTDKVVITWTKSDGADKYEVFRDAGGLGELGDVATYDDSGAGAPTVTPGTASASDGTSELHVTLSLAGESANNGTTYAYTVKAGNDGGWSAASGADNGYRGVGAVTYAWQRSAADSDENFGAIGGGTTDPYNDTGAPANGDGRWYYCEVSATGAATQDSTHNRGYRDTALSPPTSFVATTINDNQIDITWVKGAGSDKTLIRGQQGSYPTTKTDGYQVYFDTGTSCSDTTVSLNELAAKMYYRAWGEDTGAYSATYAEDNTGGESVLFLGILGLGIGISFLAARSSFFPLKMLAGFAWFGVFTYWLGADLLTDGTPGDAVVMLVLLMAGLLFLFWGIGSRGKQNIEVETDNRGAIIKRISRFTGKEPSRGSSMMSGSNLEYRETVRQALGRGKKRKR